MGRVCMTPHFPPGEMPSASGPGWACPPGVSTESRAGSKADAELSLRPPGPPLLPPRGGSASTSWGWQRSQPGKWSLFVSGRLGRACGPRDWVSGRGSGGTAALSSLPSGKEEFRPAETRGWSLVSHPGLQTGFSSLHRHRWSPESTEQKPESSPC